MTGGVAEFSLQIANTLNKQRILNSVITPVVQVEDNELPIIAPYKINWIPTQLPIKHLHNKIQSLQYKFFYLKCIFLILNNRESTFFFTYIDDLYAIPLIKICHKFKVKFIVLLHGKDILRISCKNSDLLDFLVSNSQRLIFNSLATANLFEKYSNVSAVNSRNIWYPGGRFDYLDQLEPRPIESLDELPKDAYIISSVCRLVKRKGINFSIQAFLKLILNAEFKNIYYVIAGEGPEKEDLEQLAQKSGGKILFLGSVTEGQKKFLLQKSDIFIMPNSSVKGTDFEGFGISFIEAAYFNNIVIGGNSGGASEAIKMCPRGILVDTDIDDPVSCVSKALNMALQALQTNSENIQNINSTNNILRKKLDLEKNVDHLISSFKA